jgi:hypothetical protein
VIRRGRIARVMPTTGNIEYKPAVVHAQVGKWL